MQLARLEAQASVLRRYGVFASGMASRGINPGAFDACHLALRQWYLTFALA